MPLHVCGIGGITHVPVLTNCGGIYPGSNVRFSWYRLGVDGSCCLSMKMTNSITDSLCKILKHCQEFIVHYITGSIVIMYHRTETV